MLASLIHSSVPTLISLTSERLWDDCFKRFHLGALEAADFFQFIRGSVIF